MRVETTKIDANGISFKELNESTPKLDESLFDGQVCVTDTGLDGLIAYWHKATEGESHVVGQLSVIQEYSETPLTYDDLMVFVEQITAEGMLDIHVWYIDAQYPIVDEGWGYNISVTKLGQANFFGYPVEDSSVYAAATNGNKYYQVRTNGEYKNTLSYLADLCRFDNFGIVEKNNYVTFACDVVYGAERYPTSMLAEYTKDANSDFSVRVHFTHVYWELICEGSLELTLRAVVEAVVEHYGHSFNESLHAFDDFKLMIELACKGK